MNPSTTFIKRPVATTLLTIGLTLAGGAAFFLLPVSPLPQVDFPTINVQATLPGASPETVSTSVATPLERYLGRIADVSEMTSMSTVGSANVTLQFGLNRDINGAARDVQAAINAARVDLPAALRSNPIYRKLNPADAPILILTLTSKTRSQGQIYDVASTILAQKLAQVEGIGEVRVGGSSLPAVRIELNPTTLFKYGIGLEDVRAAVSSANANTPKGAIEDNGYNYQISMNDQARVASDYKDIVIAYRNDAPVVLSQVAEVIDSVEDTRNTGLLNGEPAVLLIISRQPGANIIGAVDRVKALIPELQGSIPNDIVLGYASDRTTTIRASLREVELTLVISVFLVIGVVLLFLKDPRAALIPAVVVPVSLIGTFGIMYLCGYSLDNLSLMALTVATGFVVDDAVVVLENIARHMENGVPRMEAALRGAHEVGFTVLSMSVSLIAVFIPILLMGGIIGRLFREFAVVLSVAILVSLVISLSTTPMMCAYLLRNRNDTGSVFFRFGELVFRPLQRLYERTLDWALANPRIIMLSLVVTVGVNIYLYGAVPKGFIPQQDSGRLVGNMRADQSASFQSMREKFTQLQQIMKEDPAVDIVVGFASGAGGFTFAQLKPLAERKVSSDEVLARLRPKLSRIAGAQLFLQVAQEFRMGGRQSSAQYQYTLQSDSLDDLRTWTPKIAAAVKTFPGLADVDTDQQEKGLEIRVSVDRDTASRLGLTAQQIDNNLYDFFGQRQVSTIYNALNQYHVVMEVAPEFRDNPKSLDDVYIASTGAAVSGVSGTNAVAGTFRSATTTAATT
ncbi:MAG: efflux RND transporter permease subunit, partial [Clostridia bacterium]|nr:efflux RND transporter permease subunit [Deltaproteobacteria bacterium]